ncbi:hypothetical protein [Polluticaenibacter yanchengensis]|uniref:Secreted protein n=1 Tax=Polluticaenibacter yanchengensis TaxID=3014562 RepID=A0ABT4UGF9_9BACT|nr:hypothetical protein [Chitinophagaceae bacterium LY-5]
MGLSAGVFCWAFVPATLGSLRSVLLRRTRPVVSGSLSAAGSEWYILFRYNTFNKKATDTDITKIP